MPTATWNLQFLNHNAQRAYPLAADGTGEDVTGAFRIPNDFLVGLYLPVHAGMDVLPGRFFLRKLNAYAQGYGLTIGYQSDDSTVVDVASALIPSTTARNQIHVLGGLNEFRDTRGWLIVGSQSSIAKQPAGLFRFDLTGTRLEADCVRPIIRGISSVRVRNGTSTSPRVYGHVTLVAGNNTRLTYTAPSGDTPAQIRIDAIAGEGLNELCACNDTNTGTPIKTINGIGPNSSGNFNLQGTDCLEFEGATNGLVVRNSCSKPCCGCKELEEVTTALQTLGSQAVTTQQLVSNLDSRITQMLDVIMASKFGTSVP